MRMQDCDAIVAALANPDIPEDTLRQMIKDARANSGLFDAGKTPERTAWLEEMHDTRSRLTLQEFGYDNRLAPSGATSANRLV